MKLSFHEEGRVKTDGAKVIEVDRIRVPLESPKQTHKPGSDFYKNYLETRNKPKETKRYTYTNNLNLSLEIR